MITVSHGGGFLLAACDINVPISVMLFDFNLVLLR